MTMLSFDGSGAVMKREQVMRELKGLGATKAAANGVTGEERASLCARYA